jgi:hypothetical protein
MRKIATLFQRNYETDRLVRDEVVPGAEWVLGGEGVATRKFDGRCCLVRRVARASWPGQSERTTFGDPKGR